MSVTSVTPVTCLVRGGVEPIPAKLLRLHPRIRSIVPRHAWEPVAGRHRPVTGLGGEWCAAAAGAVGGSHQGACVARRKPRSL
jgi:hypothetical protein